MTALVAAPPALLALLLRPRWREGLGLRLGRTPRLAPGVVWVHGASVGEVLAATRLLDALAQRGERVLASSMTAAGRQVLQRARPELPSTLAPLDHPWCVAAALERVAPRALVLVETELWPAWIAGAARRRIPVLAVSARLSARSLARYRRAGRLLAPTWQRLAAVGARTPEDAERFLALGIPAERVRVTGNLKLEPPERVPALAPDLAALLGDGKAWVAASTHAPEEEVALDALALVEAAGPATVLVLAPRRMERIEEVAALVRARGRRLRRRSQAGRAPLAPGEVLLLDSLGELPGLLPRAAAVFVGGTLAPRGGHNVLEPALAGRPVLFGPHTRNVREAAELLLACGGAERVGDAGALARWLVAWLRDPDEARRRGEAGRSELARHRGATPRTLALLDEVLARPLREPR